MTQENAENNAENAYHDANGDFKKGNPGGPGRPKGQRNYASIYREVLGQIASENDVSFDEIENRLIRVAYGKAVDGDYPFYKDVQDRVHGKPMQPIDHTTKGEALQLVIPQEIYERETNPSANDNR